jgi:hypothetical protein
MFNGLRERIQLLIKIDLDPQSNKKKPFPSVGKQL